MASLIKRPSYLKCARTNYLRGSSDNGLTEEEAKLPEVCKDKVYEGPLIVASMMKRPSYLKCSRTKSLRESSEQMALLMKSSKFFLTR